MITLRYFAIPAIPMSLTNTDCPELKLIARGKVRDLYDVDEKTLLFVATDRISAFDVIMKNGIPGKGKILTQISQFWFDLLKGVVPNHLITCDVDEMPESVQKYRSKIEGRAMLVRKLKILPVEAIVRGYISGSAWSEYKKKGTICDIPLPAGLRESEEFEEPIFTPSTKAEIGDHDENIHPDKLPGIIGERYAKEVAEVAVKIYTKARDYARTKGIIIADTKFEFGVDENGTLVLADEVLTPDSSRFWPADKYAVGQGQPSYDKQYLRDYLTSINFDKSAGVELPQTVVDNTMAKYVEAFTILTGNPPQL
ncbi:phosphoribosylaminoimidazolesuccinocarboxamide synthase [Spizellomyces punctatus DAOM BR117]|uniref:Phosphoribosylaminoimidazole-succinocarboxamide synthase n=1 Tax=Spizellomyces punctatus (strain DAOM BR117) TaxID=645134 RepID=A0A0L0HMP3_SPIPD|nr:phosphoribosylaminoimidazolesuccinocarboxamide synthase [Spizellomyces punctatus DAOM BR117]KND02185.1 phosphoribosylaminoimidazolesuccinocarboxamide synthase [Spizellomyces punctatus DAOM BR117]|eukprot:XP_016610224.1 phosphoribosylaminoimidazolesuccinocarboxamide synthase [Spizellomyces punctatus DAOM BR117]